jgi:peptidoglycan biosynthesis protein MviN/MurJ (putative lipid II flippase)
MRSIFTLSSCVAAGLFIYGEPILRLLFSSGNWSPLDFHKAGNMLFIMGLGMTLGLPQIVSVKALQGIGKHWQVSYGSLAISILSLIIGISIMNTDLDIYGAAWGWSLFWGLQGILFPAMTSRYLSLSLWEMLIKTYLPGIGVGLFVLSIAWFFDNWLVASNLLNLLIGIGICSFVGGMAVLIISGYNSILWNRIINWLS